MGRRDYIKKGQVSGCRPPLSRVVPHVAVVVSRLITVNLSRLGLHDKRWAFILKQEELCLRLRVYALGELVYLEDDLGGGGIVLLRVGEAVYILEALLDVHVINRLLVLREDVRLLDGLRSARVTSVLEQHELCDEIIDEPTNPGHVGEGSGGSALVLGVALLMAGAPLVHQHLKAE